MAVHSLIYFDKNAVLMQLNWLLLKTFLFRYLMISCLVLLVDFVLGPIIQIARTTSTEVFYQEIKYLFKTDRILFNVFYSSIIAIGTFVVEKKQKK
jgi:hypothetical protein